MLAVSAFWSGCSNPINAYTGGRHFEAAESAEAAGDLTKARMLFSRAAVNADIGNLGTATQAHAWYEYARVCGYLGEVEESQRTYDRVLKLIEAGGDETQSLRAPALAEYARMLQNNGRPQLALPHYARALEALDRLPVTASDPIGFALFLDGYAECLRTVGNNEQSREIAARAEALRTQHPDAKAKFTNARVYASAGRAASGRGDWSAAARYWGLAAAGADVGTEPPQFVTTAHYEYGRSLGVTGQFARAEAELIRALELDGKNGGETYWDLTELGRLNQAQRNYTKAIEYFEKDIPIVEAQDTATRNPVEMAALLTDYADCLRHGGRTADADAVMKRATALAATAPAGADPADRTPYGSALPQPTR